MLKVLADENIPRPLVAMLRSLGIDVFWIVESESRGIGDGEVAAMANAQGRALLTRDSDFINDEWLNQRIKTKLIYIEKEMTVSNMGGLPNLIREALASPDRLFIIDPDYSTSL